MNKCKKYCILLIILSNFVRSCLVSPLYVYLSYRYTYIESTVLGIFVALVSLISDALVALAVFSMLAGIYTQIRAKHTGGAAVCAAVYILCNIAGAGLSLLSSYMLTRAGLSDMTVTGFTAEIPNMLSSAVMSLISALILIFLAFVFAFALRPASDKGTRLFAVLGYTLGALAARGADVYFKVTVYGAPADVYEVLNLSFPFITQGIFAVAGYYLMKALQNKR